MREREKERGTCEREREKVRGAFENFENVTSPFPFPELKPSSIQYFIFEWKESKLGREKQSKTVNRRKKYRQID